MDTPTTYPPRRVTTTSGTGRRPGRERWSLGTLDRTGPGLRSVVPRPRSDVPCPDPPTPLSTHVPTRSVSTLSRPSPTAKLPRSDPTTTLSLTLPLVSLVTQPLFRSSPTSTFPFSRHPSPPRHSPVFFPVLLCSDPPLTRSPLPTLPTPPDPWSVSELPFLRFS